MNHTTTYRWSNLSLVSTESNYKQNGTPISSTINRLPRYLWHYLLSLNIKSLHELVIWFAPINVLATLAICIALLTLTPNLASAKWVFTHFTDGSGWGVGFSFLLSFLSVAWKMTDYDGQPTCLKKHTMQPSEYQWRLDGLLRALAFWAGY